VRERKIYIARECRRLKNKRMRERERENTRQL